MELTPAERLQVHLSLHYPNIRMKDVTLSHRPGYLKTATSMIDIRGASYHSDSHQLRLWDELHEYFSQHVEVIKRKNGQPTSILWNGMYFTLDQRRTYKQSRRREPRKRTRDRREVINQ